MKYLFRVMLAFCLLVAPPMSAKEVSLYTVSHFDISAMLKDRTVMQYLRGEKRTWPNGMAVTVILPGKSSPDYNIAGDAIVQGSGKSLQRRWLREVFRGRANAPIYVDSPQQALDALIDKPGAIAVTTLSPDALPASLHAAKLP